MSDVKHIVLVDDHVIVRHGLRELIEKIGPYKIVGEFDDGLDLIRAIPFKQQVDLLVMDISMPGLTGDKTLEKLKEMEFGVPVLILTLKEDEELIIRLFRLGARGFLKKNCSAETLKVALREIFRTGFYHNEFLTMSLQKEIGSHKKTESEIILDQLSAREREFLKLVCNEKEYTYEQIADIMSVQHRTVDGYRESLFSKFNIKSKTGLVLFVLKHNLFQFL